MALILFLPIVLQHSLRVVDINLGIDKIMFQRGGTYCVVECRA